jgi:hypothetical protein
MSSDGVISLTYEQRQGDKEDTLSLSHALLSSVLLYLFRKAVAETRQPQISGVVPSE